MTYGQLVKTIFDMRAGLHRECDPTLIPEGACADGENVVVEDGAIRVRPGRARHTALPASGAVRALAEYTEGGDTPNTRLVGVVDQAVYASDLDDQEFGDGLTLDTTVSATNRPRLAQFNEYLYLVDGAAPVKRWDGTDGDGTVVEALQDVAAPTQPPTVAESAAASQLGDFAAGSTTGMETNDAVEWTRPDWWNANDFDIGASDVDGVCARLFTNTLTPSKPIFSTGRATCVGLEFVNDARLDDTTGKGWMIQELATPVNLQYADTLTLRLLVHCQEREWLDNIKMQVQFAATVSGALKSLTTLDHAFDVPFNHLAGDIADTELVKTIDISALTAEEKAAIRYMAIKIDRMEVGNVARLQVDDTVFRHNLSGFAVTFFFDALEANVAEPQFVAGMPYEFTYTYEYEEGQPPLPVESNPQRDAEGRYATLTTTDHTIGLRVTPILDPGATCPRINVYARGGTEAEFRRIAALEADAENLTVDWDGQYQGDMAYMEPYVSRPPAGMQLLHARNGRMYYAKDDTLYISNWDRPDLVPSADIIIDMGGEYGGFVKIGADGKPITGLGSFGPFLLIFKAQGAWVQAGNDATDFAIKPLSAHVGCASHETIQSLDGNALAWLGVDGRVWAWDGARFTDLGEAITPLLQTASQTQLAAGFAVYDPVRRWYVLTVPGAGACGASSYCFALRSKSWMPRWTGQPGGCALFAAHATTPGVYAGDNAAGGYLYRMHAGTTDATASTEAAPIAWSWFGKVFREPFALLYKVVQRVVAWVAGTGPATLLTLHLRLNGGGTDHASKTLSADVAPDQPRQAQWRPAYLPDAANYQIGISGTANAALEIPRLDVVLSPRSMVR